MRRLEWSIEGFAHERNRESERKQGLRICYDTFSVTARC